MPQTVYDVGDLITSRLNLGVTPDGSTSATVVVRRPDGTALGSLNTSAWTGMEKTVQFYATDDGTAGASTASAAGDWLAVWTVTGTGASVSAKVYNVVPLPGTGTRPAWSPFLSQVADHVPFLTEDSVTPGQLWLGTFTGTTSPTDEQAQRHVDTAASVVAARVGVIPAALYPLARTATALRAAASILRAFARGADDRTAADALDVRADLAFAALVDGAETAGSAAATGPLPVGYFPEPVAHGDYDL